MDCDRDSLIYLAEPIGPACHTNAPTCYFTQLAVAGGALQERGSHDSRAHSPATTLFALERTIQQRREEMGQQQPGGRVQGGRGGSRGCVPSCWPWCASRQAGGAGSASSAHTPACRPPCARRHEALLDRTAHFRPCPAVQKGARGALACPQRPAACSTHPGWDTHARLACAPHNLAAPAATPAPACAGPGGGGRAVPDVGGWRGAGARGIRGSRPPLPRLCADERAGACVCVHGGGGRGGRAHAARAGGGCCTSVGGACLRLLSSSNTAPAAGPCHPMQGVSLEEVCQVLRSRFGTSGVEEKAGRPPKPAA